MTTVRNVALALALAGAAATVHAGVKASAVTTANGVYSFAEDFLPLNEAGATTLKFKLSGAGKKVLTYSATGAVYGPMGAWLDLDIYVNGVIVAPTVGGGDPFCGANETTQADGWIRASITVPIQGISGDNTVQIKARRSWNATGMWFGNSALVIYD